MVIGDVKNVFADKDTHFFKLDIYDPCTQGKHSNSSNTVTFSVSSSPRISFKENRLREIIT